MVVGAEHGLDSLRLRAAWLRGTLVTLLVVDVAATLVGLVVLYFQMTSPYGFTFAFTQNPELLSILMGASGIAILLFLILTLLIIVMLMLWVHRAWQNLRDANLDDLNYSPGWAIGSFFVPFINLVVPMRAMRELANRSAGEDAWQAALPVADINSWWSCLIAGLFVRSIVLFVTLVDSIPYLHVTTPLTATMALGLLGNLLLMGSTWFLYRTIGVITRDQGAMLHVSGTFD